MMCPRCKESGVFVQHNTFQYYYCRTCKDEIQLEVVERKVGMHPALGAPYGETPDMDLLKEFERLIQMQELEREEEMHRANGYDGSNPPPSKL